jgi:formylmethanofuran dehydrogenase subunit B
MGSLPTNRNGQGANNVLASLTGFPDAVRFTRSGPVHNGTEYSTAATTRRKECDMLLVCDIGTNASFESNLAAETIGWLKTIPVVVLSDLLHSCGHTRMDDRW